MDQQFSLSWNNFHGNLSKGFAGLLGNAEFVDVTLAVEGHLLQAHKVILSICSPYFKRMFQLNPCQHPIVVLRDVSHKAMRDLLQFMYHGEVSVKREDLTSFIGTAEVLQIKGLTNKQAEEDNINKHNEDHSRSNEIRNNSPETQSFSSEPLDGNAEDPVQNNETEMNLIKQREFIDRLQRLTNMKRKSEEFIQKNFYNTTDIYNSDKKQKKAKPNNEQNVNNMFDSPVDATKYNLNKGDVQLNDDNDNIDHEMVESNGEIKTEFEDSDIIVTDPAVCTTPKSDTRDGQKEHIQYNQNLQDTAVPHAIDGLHLPVRYKYIYSRKGHKQLVHMNFVYTKHSTSHGKTAWRCVQYFSLNRCPATVETVDAMIYAINHQHNHENCYEKLTKNNIYYEVGDKC